MTKPYFYKGISFSKLKRYNNFIMKKVNTKYQSYNKLAWTEEIVALPDDSREETIAYVQAIKNHSKKELKTLLHLGCGAGGHDYTFKKYFQVTGIDISKDMLKIAKKRNPEITYHCNDMRSIKLKEKFDVVVIPDSIGYITTVKDLEKVIKLAYEHLNFGGVLLITSLVSEEFKENNFVYTGSSGGIEITVFENNYILNKLKTTYEATLVYLIRNKGKLKIYTENQIIGIFRTNTWLNLFKKAKFTKVKKIKLDYLYDKFILEEGRYVLKAFICVK